MVMRFIERGYAVASIGYRLAPAHTFPAQIHDVKRAIRELKVFGEREGLIDGDRIVVFGTSAGGHLAALAGATPGSFEPADLTPEQATFDSTVAGVVSVVGPTDLISFQEQSIWPDLAATFLGCEACSAAQLAEASPLTHLGPDLPPAYWAYGANDDVVDPTAQGAAIASAWAEQAGPDSSWFDLIEGHGHNIPHWAINQRELEKFVAYAIAQR
jgi:acetyl esterase/lipase